MRCVSAVCSALAVLLMTAFGATGFAQDADASNRAMIQYIAQAYRNHLDKFPFAQARMNLTELAWATSVEDGLNGNWLNDPQPVVADIHWVMDGDTTRTERIYSEDVIEKYTIKSGDGFVSRRFTSECQLRNSRHEVLYFVGSSAHLASVGRRTHPSWSPFDYAIGPPLDEQMRKYATVYEGDLELNGEKLPVVRLDKSPQVDRIWVDPNVGHNPVRIESTFGSDREVTIVTEVGDFTLYDGDRWVAHSLLQVTKNNRGTPARYFVRGWRIVEFDAQKRPQPDALQLRVPQNTWISNSLSNGHPGYRAIAGIIDLQAFTDQGELKPGTSGLEIRTDHAHAPATLTIAAENEWPFGAIGQSRFRWILPLVLVVAVVVVVGTYRWRRTR